MTDNNEKTTETTNPPVAKLRIGVINASIWQRSHETSTFHSVTFERRYRDAKNEWHSTGSFNTEDLLILAKLADQAHTKILELRAGEKD